MHQFYLQILVLLKLEEENVVEVEETELEDIKEAINQELEDIIKIKL
jgi:hypothetical protein